MKYHRFVSAVCLLMFLFACVLPVSAQTGLQSTEGITVVNAQWTSITNANWINDLAFDAEGYLWAATSGGAVRWDVNTGTYVKYTSEHGLCSNQLSAVAITQDGTVWLGSRDNGLSSLKNGVFQNYTTKDGLPYNFILDIAIAPEGTLWVLTDWDLCSFDGQNWKIYNDTPLKEIGTTGEYIECDLDGNLWIGSSLDGIFRKSGDEWAHYNDPDELINIVRCMVPAADGSVWASLQDADLVHYTDDNAEIISLNSEDSLFINSLYIEEDGTIWLADWADIIRVKDGVWDTFSGDYTQDMMTKSIIEGPDGTIWCGGFMGGLAGYKDGEWTVWQTDDWLPDNSVQKVMATESGGLWILSSTAVTYYNGETAQVFQTDWKALDLLIAPDESVWVSLGKNGVYRFIESQWTFFGPGDTQDGFVDYSFSAMLDEMEMMMGDEFDTVFGEVFADIDVESFDDADDGSVSVIIAPTQIGSGIALEPWYTSILLDATGRLLCVSVDGDVHSLFNGKWTVLDTPSDSVSDMLMTQEGVYWLSSHDALYRSIDEKNWTSYPEIMDSKFIIYHYGSLYVTHEDVCWIASVSGVGCQPADGNSFFFKIGNGIPEENVSCVAGTPDGTIWIGTTYCVSLENGAGVGRYDGSEWQIITASDGLASNAVHDIFMDTDYLWFGTNGGISVFKLH